ncbi:ATP-binding protein/SpoIIE family protein phosphatase [Actinokineospora auranticolor]|uniref:Anti-sigma regulatory factor (Ser/Thr protein kinase) n=1 Tax=Actinokineospora auranticolor TaxID=155976 RepID=A0A2S6GDB1_9PSEU|nr:ATP-binding SpoIIE family protein phosphatase [Actinokineospora auranticolor]PPK63086.1 anti-sigma regulatory factor (Ser/Thr protein kinase) [Actinokineospora auranticolor]
MSAGTDHLPTAEDVIWLPVEELSAVGAARRAVANLAERLAFPGSRAAEVGIAVTEIATNLCKHADQGVLLLRALRTADHAEIEVAAVDNGPGIPDTELAFLDGHSTTGTLGIGLGAVRRLADVCSLRSTPDGTVLAARFGPDRRTVPTPGFAIGVTKPIAGEEVCGDAYAIRRDGDRLLLMLCDGAGHGPLAASASRAAVRAFLDGDWAPPERVVRRLHTAMLGTRGGAVAVAELDPTARTLRYAGVGNIAGAVVSERKNGLVSLPGVAGYQARTVREFTYDLPPGAVVVMHSDGLNDRWGVDPVVRWSADPLVIGLELLREAGVRRDDASVVVAKPGAR